MERMNETLDQTVAVQKPAFPTSGDLLAMLGIFFGVQLVVSLISSLVLFAMGCSVAVLEPLELGRFMAFTSLVSLALTALLIELYRRHRQAPKVHVHLGFKGINPLLVVWCFALMLAASVALEPLYELLPVPHQDPGRGWWAFFAVVVVAPLFEEWICRGVIFGALRLRHGVVVSILLSALIFGLMHVQPVPVLNAFVLGLVLAFIYHKTKTLWSSILLHALYNGMAFALTVTGFGERSFRSLFGEQEGLYLVAYGVALALLVGSFFAIRKILKKSAE